MNKFYYIISGDGTEILDTTLLAEDRIKSMDYLLKREERNKKYQHNKVCCAFFNKIFKERRKNYGSRKN